MKFTLGELNVYRCCNVPRVYLLSSSDSEMEEGASNSPHTTHHHGNPWLDMSAPVLLLNSDPRQEKGVAEEDTEPRGLLRGEYVMAFRTSFTFSFRRGRTRGECGPLSGAAGT